MIGKSKNSTSAFGSIDWTVVLIYCALVIMGWINIYAAVYDENHASIFDLGQRYGMQIVWIGICAFLAASILLIDSKYYHMWAYPLYWISLFFLVLVLFVGREVNGAKAWFYIGSLGIQPAEFVKFTTSLALARYMSNYTFSIHSTKNLIVLALILALPVTIILMQPDVGSALVYGSFVFMLYREGFNGWIYLAVITMLLLFVLSFLFEPIFILMVLMAICLIATTIVNKKWRQKVIYTATVFLAATIIYLISFAVHGTLSYYSSLLISITASMPLLIVYSYRSKVRNYLFFILFFWGSLGFTYTIDYAFNNVMQVHQQKRILDLLGLESDLKGWGYNVNQSKIAIGSGGFLGKGFLNGTQTKYNFVPEQSTDFIFCTIGEEWGFVGSALVVILFGTLILRIMKMGERQRESFGRIYCYCVASIFLTHLLINIGMTIGLMPVIGIPLPFFSYGGSSLIVFTVMLFVAVKMDSSKKEFFLQ